MSQKTRSTFSIEAVAQAVASGAVKALNPVGKLNAIAGLAGFVLRLFRSKEQTSPEAGQPPARIQQGSSKAVGKRAGVKKGGLRHG